MTGRRAAGAAVLAAVLTACGSGDEDGMRDAAHAGSADAAADASAPRDAATDGAADAAADAAGDAADDSGAQRDAGSSDPPPVIGADYVRFDALQPSPHGVVRVAFEAPDDAVSFVVTVDPDAAPRAIRLIELRGPSGLLWSALEPEPHAFEPLVQNNSSEFVPYALMLPSAPELPLEPGRYELALRAGTSAGAPVRADVVFKRAADEPLGGSLTPALWFVPGAGLDAAAAETHARLQNGLAAAADILGAVGITVAESELRDLTGEGAEELALLEGDVEIAELLALLAAEDAGSQARALHVVFVAAIDTGPGKTVRGKTTGLPGPPAHPELARRGAVIVALDELPVTADRIGEMLAHEAAHYLGLRHTSEFDGVRHDPLADTPECPAERASQMSSDGTPLLSAEDCQDLDGANLLFYTPPLRVVSQDELSADQAFVLVHSPLVR
jgi:hypothetical protein